MGWTPLTEAEAQGRGTPAQRRTLEALARLGDQTLTDAAACSPRAGTLTDEMILAAYHATRESWGGATLDLTKGDVLNVSTGYAVSTGAQHSELSHDDAACLRRFADQVITMARKVPRGQLLGIFHDDDKGTVDFDTVYYTCNRTHAYAVAAAGHATGGIYDFATGDGVWPFYLDEGK